MSDPLYTSEQITEIMKDFQKVLMNVRTVSSAGLSPDYRQFWTAFRKDGSALFELTNYLLEELSIKKEEDIGEILDQWVGGKLPLTHPQWINKGSEADDLWQDDGGEG